MFRDRSIVVGAVCWVAIAALFCVLTVVHAAPLAAVADTHLILNEDISGGAWSLIGMATQFLRDPLRPFDGNNLYPYDRTLAVLDHQMTSAALVAPGVAAGLGDVLLFNLALLGSFTLSGLMMCVLMTRVTGSRWAGGIAGCAFGWSAFRAFELPHPHLLQTQWIPLALLALYLFVEHPGRRRWLALAAAALLVALSSLHMAQLGGLALAVVALTLVASFPVRPAATRLAALALIGVLAVVVLLPIATTYTEIASHWPPPTGQGRETLGSLVEMSLRPADLVVPPPGSRSPLARWLPRSARPGAFPGAVTLALAVVGMVGIGWPQRGRWPSAPRVLAAVSAAAVALWLAASVAAIVAGENSSIAAVARTASPVVIGGLAAILMLLLLAPRIGRAGLRARVGLTATMLVLTGTLLSLGPRVVVAGVDLGSGLARYDLLPVQLIIRAPSRFSLLSALGLAMLAGLGADRLLRSPRVALRAALAAGLLFALNVELAVQTPELIEVPPMNATDRWLRDVPEPGAVIEYPLPENYWQIHRSYRYDRRTVNGAGYLLPPAVRRLEAVPDFSQEQLEILWHYFRPRFVVIRSELYPEDRRAEALAALEATGGALRRRFRHGDEYVYELEDRGRGPALMREWPAGALRRSEGVIRADLRVSAGRPGTTPRLTVLFNGAALWVGRGRELETWRERTFAIGDLPVLPGPNVVELRADYRFADGVPPNQLGETGLEIAADLLLEADPGRSLIEVNGRQFFGGYGYLVVAVDPDRAEVLQSASFDTFGSPTASDGLADFIGGLSPGALVLVATRHDAGRNLGPEAVRALRQLGMLVDLRSSAGVGHVGIGVVGSPPGTAIESSGEGAVRLELGAPERRRVQLRGLQLE